MIKTLCDDYGRIKYIYLKFDGTAVLKYKYYDDAKNTLMLNDENFKGNKISVTYCDKDEYSKIIASFQPTTLVVTGLNNYFYIWEIRNLFNSYGIPKSIMLRSDEYVFVDYYCEYEAEAALRLNGSEFMRRIITVNYFQNHDEDNNIINIKFNGIKYIIDNPEVIKKLLDVIKMMKVTN